MLLAALCILVSCHGFFTSDGSNPSPGTTARFAYVSNQGLQLGAISAFSVDATSGLLTPITTVPTASTSAALGIDAAGTVLYVADPFGNLQGGGLIEGFLINRNTSPAGGLQTVSGSPFCWGQNACTGTNGQALTEPVAIAVTPGAHFVYALNQKGPNLLSPPAIAVFAIGSNGTLSFVDNSQTVSITDGVLGLTVDPEGRFLYAADASNLYAYTINSSTGVLTPSANPIAVRARDVVMDPKVRFAYVASESAGINAYVINASNGSLTSMGNPVATGGTALRLAMDPQGKFLFAVNSDTDTVVGFSINSDGTLASAGSASITNGAPTAAAVDPGGAFLYVTTDPGGGNLGLVNEFRIGSGGALTFLGTAQTNIVPYAIVVSE